MLKKLVIILIIASLFTLYLNKSSNNKLHQIKINGYTLQVEIADNDSTRSKGLSGRKYMAENTGMLFIFPTVSNHHFWIKGMLIPLDFVWINENTVVDLTTNVLPPLLTDVNLPTFTAKSPFNKVIELNARKIQELNIKIGDTIEFN